jgi:hypothetical protein
MSGDSRGRKDSAKAGGPGLSGAGRSRRDERERRLAERLRDNLKKRKAQDRARRGREDGGTTGGEGA